MLTIERSVFALKCLDFVAEAENLVVYSDVNFLPFARSVCRGGSLIPSLLQQWERATRHPNSSKVKSDDFMVNDGDASVPELRG